MAKRGAKPKPTAIKMLEGNPGRRELSPDEPKPEPLRRDAPPPAILNEDGKAEWIRISPILRGLGLLTKADLPALTLYCAAWARWTDAENRMAQIQKAGGDKSTALLVTTPNGHSQPNPLLTISRQNAELCIKILAEFGLTPSSRSRVNAPPPHLPPEEEAQGEPPPEMVGGMAGLIGKRPRPH